MTARDEAGRRKILDEVVDAISSLTRELAAAGDYPFRERRLSRAQMNLLYQLSRHDGLGVGALARLLDVTSGAVSQHVETLRAAGLVTVRVDPADRRARMVSLTRIARTEVDDFQRGWIDAVAPRFDDLTDDDVLELRRLLALVRA